MYLLITVLSLWALLRIVSIKNMVIRIALLTFKNFVSISNYFEFNNRIKVTT
jgi:hypothetical protein